MADYQPNPPLLQACRDKRIRRQILTQLSMHDICALRLTSFAFSNMVTSSLFTNTRLNFSPSAFSRQCRIEALSRIGHHIKHFTFSMHHSDATFLPPLLNPKTGMEIGFMYTPHTSLESEKERPKYGTSELANYLTAQYPAIFHAATNVPTFIRALACMPNLEQISISCPDQESVERYRRSAVDYALISLRIAIERAELPLLSKFSLACHPAALLYLHPTPNFGASPSALRRWRQIKNLKLSIDAWPFENAPTDHLKLLANYLRAFAGSVEKLKFHWVGARGPCPLTMAVPTSRPASPNSSFGHHYHSPVSPTSTSQKLFAEITSSMSPLPLTPAGDPIHFEKLRRVQVRNTYVAAEQVSSFITRHASSLKGMDFDNVVLTTGTWDDALLPLGRLSTKEAIWEARHSGGFTGKEVDILSCGSSATTLVEDAENPYRWQPKKEVVEDKKMPLRESFVEARIASTPSHVNIAKKHRRRRRRRTASPPPSLPSLRYQASHLFGKLKKEASQSSFFSMFKHHDSASSTGSFEKIKEVEDDRIFLATPGHNRTMPSVPTNQEDYFDLGEHDFSQPSYEPQLQTLLQPTTYSPVKNGAPSTPPRTPTKQHQHQRHSGTPRSQIWEFDRPSSLNSIEEAALLSNKTYSPIKAADSRHPLDRVNRQPTVEDAPLTPPESPIQLLSPSVYTPSSSTKTSSAKNTSSPCHRRQQRQEERVRGQPVPRPPMVKMPALTPMLESVKTPVTPWPTSLHRSYTPMPLKIDTNVALRHQAGMDSKIQGNHRDLAREAQYKELAGDATKRDEILRTTRERVMGRLGRKYSGHNNSSTSLASQAAAMGRTTEINLSEIARGIGRIGRSPVKEVYLGTDRGVGLGGVREEAPENMVRGGQVQEAVRREIWSGCAHEFKEVRESTMGGGKERSVLVPFMILR